MVYLVSSSAGCLFIQVQVFPRQLEQMHAEYLYKRPLSPSPFLPTSFTLFKSVTPEA